MAESYENVEQNIQTNAHYSFINQAYLAIYGYETQDEAMKALTPFYPHYNPADTTLTTDYDTAFKDAHTDHSPAPVGSYALPAREKNIVKDYPFYWQNLGDFSNGTAGAIESLTRESNNN